MIDDARSIPSRKMTKEEVEVDLILCICVYVDCKCFCKFCIIINLIVLIVVISKRRLGNHIAKINISTITRHI